MSNLNPTPSDLSPEELRILFFMVVRALTFESVMSLTPRQKLLIMLLAAESFGEGSPSGRLHLKAWRRRLEPPWRSNELNDLLQEFKCSAWMTVDTAEGTYWLAPDRLPGWEQAMAQYLREGTIPLSTPDDLNKVFAKISQAAGLRAAIAIAKAPRGRPPDLASITFVSGRSPADLSGSLRSGGDATNLAAPPRGFSRLKDLKNHKGSKPLQDLTALKDLLLVIEFGSEEKAYNAMRGILGFDVMEGGDKDPRTGEPRMGDGGKWRNRWRTNRSKVHRVFASLIEEIGSANPPKSRGAVAEKRWQEMTEVKHA